jgi:hypothetical protein
LWIGLVFGGFIALVVFTLTVGRPVIDYVVDMFRNVEEYNADPASMPPLPLGPYFLVSFASSAYSWVICSLCGYAALRIVDALRFEDFGEDMKDVGLYTFYFFLIMLLPALLWMGLGEYGETIENGGTLLLLVAVGLLLQLTAWIIIVVILKRHWDLSFGKLVGVVLLFLVFAIGSTFVYAIAYYVIIIATLI